MHPINTLARLRLPWVNKFSFADEYLMNQSFSFGRALASREMFVPGVRPSDWWLKAPLAAPAVDWRKRLRERRPI